ncbi:hypothetical protein [Bacillus rhizoplanae]
MLGLLGRPNEAGKSTTSNILATVLSPGNDEVQVFMA